MQGSRPGKMKRRIAVVGGVYRERCRLPYNSDETWGSGGRAAAVIAGLGLETTLYTAAGKETEGLLASLAQTFQFETVATNVAVTRQFQYDHALSSPVIWPPIGQGESVLLNVQADNALVFGMLEASAEVRANCVVYDPQSPISPEPFRPAAGSSPRVAYVLNGSEAAKLAPSGNPEEAGHKIAAECHAEVVVIKRGAWGALVCEGGRSERIPAYATERIWPIGSGDVFAAVFAARWAGDGVPAVEAAMQASRAAALYVNDRVPPITAESLAASSPFPFNPILLDKGALQEGEFHVYLAGPFFNIAQRWLVEESRMALLGMGLRVFSPLHDVGMGLAHDVAPKDIEALKVSRSVLALVDGLDAGTLFEIGYARSLGRPVVVLAQSTPEEPLNQARSAGPVHSISVAAASGARRSRSA
jgi:Nucleoside 2-deoxyribosyltransferase/pfkB family carbohydrate kinase